MEIFPRAVLLAFACMCVCAFVQGKYVALKDSPVSRLRLHQCQVEIETFHIAAIRELFVYLFR